jgi:hypothetical protein
MVFLCPVRTQSISFIGRILSHHFFKLILFVPKIVDFEDLPATATTRVLPGNYRGFIWWTFDYFHRDFYNGVHSGLFAINNNAATTFIDFGSEVGFNGAYFAKYPPHLYSVAIT